MAEVGSDGRTQHANEILSREYAPFRGKKIL